MVSSEAMKTFLLNLVLLRFIGHGLSTIPYEMPEFPQLSTIECNDKTEEYFRQNINVSNLVLLTYHEDYIYFFFDRFFIKQTAPYLSQQTTHYGEFESKNSQALYLSYAQGARYEGEYIIYQTKWKFKI